MLSLLKNAVIIVVVITAAVTIGLFISEERETKRYEESDVRYILITTSNGDFVENAQYRKNRGPADSDTSDDILVSRRYVDLRNRTHLVVYDDAGNESEHHIIE